MAPRIRRRNKRSTASTNGVAWDWFGGLSLIVLTGFVFFSSFLSGGERAYAKIDVAGSGGAADYARFEDPLRVVDARLTARGHLAGAVQTARAAIPLVPWGDYGLADIRLDLDQARWDEGRGRYVISVGEGRTAILTLDRRTQSRLEDVVARYTEPGEAAVAIEPETGRIMAVVSDGEDPALSSLATRSLAWAASTFKVITGASLLEHRMANPETMVCYHGGGQGLTDDLLVDDDELDTLCITLRRAMALSANVVFGKLATRHLTPERLQSTAERFGFNQRIPLEFDVDRSTADIPAVRLDFASSAAGFRYTRMSPLHGALIQAAIANDGVLMVPTVVERVEDAAGETIWTHEPVEWDRVLTPEQANALRNLQQETCVNGTARRQFSQRPGWPASIRSWGKTGTLSNAEIDGSQPQPAYIYSWFTGFAESGDRQIAVAGLSVQPPSWQIKGAYLASEAVLAYLHGRGGE